MKHLEKLFTTLECAEKAGVSLRQLQYWDERGYLKAVRGPGNRRKYSESQIYAAKKLKMLSIQGHSVTSRLARFVSLAFDKVVIVRYGKPVMIGNTLVVARSKQR